MPLVANFESERRGDAVIRSRASFELASAFSDVHNAVATYEDEDDRTSIAIHDGQLEGVDSQINSAKSSFGRAGQLYGKISASEEPLVRELRIDLPFSQASLSTGLFGVALGRLSIGQQQIVVASEMDLTVMAISICQSAQLFLDYAGKTKDPGFERNFRLSLIDLSHLHVLAIALSEAFAQSFAD